MTPREGEGPPSSIEHDTLGLQSMSAVKYITADWVWEQTVDLILGKVCTPALQQRETQEVLPIKGAPRG